MEYIYNKHGINKNTYDLLFNEKEEYKKECSKELMTVELFLSNKKILNRKAFIWLERLIDMQYYKINYFNIRKRLLNNSYIYKDENIKFEFYKLEKYLNKILKEEDNYVKEEMNFLMKYNLIKGNCYAMNMILASNIKDSYLVTGLLTFEDGTTHLHAYVEYIDYIIDFTKNLIIKKNIYYKLLKVTELGKIKSKDISNIYNLTSENTILNTTRYMALFGDEIITDLNKNKQLLKQPNNNKPDFNPMFY